MSALRGMRVTLGWVLTVIGVVVAALAGFADCTYSLTPEGRFGKIDLLIIVYTATFFVGVGLIVLGYWLRKGHWPD